MLIRICVVVWFLVVGLLCLWVLVMKGVRKLILRLSIWCIRFLLRLLSIVVIL